MIGTAKIFWLGLNELNDEKVLKRNILTRDLILWIFGMSHVHTYRILATQIINMFYHTYILLYYQNSKCTFTIILL